MSTGPHTASCARCHAPRNGWSDTCPNCGFTDRPTMPPSAGPPAPRPAGPAPTQYPQAAPAQPPAGFTAPGYPQAPLHHPYQQPAVQIVTAKSPGIGVLLSFLWLGAGHLYVGSIGVGIALVVVEMFLLLLSILPILWILTIPAWWIAFIFAAIHVSRAAAAYNQRNGIIVR